MEQKIDRNIKHYQLTADIHFFKTLCIWTIDLYALEDTKDNVELHVI